MQLIRITEVSDITSLSKSSIYRRIRQGEFPPSISLGGSVRVWKLEQVQQWIADLIQAQRGGANDE
ncbi:AlpA family phage regulatory protein [Vibrio sp. SCSIO 43169]|uniref:helix-turn-helix transcriptional regulator n=1 Tax=Vibrio sp. SCSIO 43169 TaxID=2822801 RepID=UPI002043C21C|nr:AlpA family phage regulatory protein [Vibrio sp. SCSIO 43169]MCM5506714.1 AlpA family phage regulatory protein [Vibrio sp. SCSIO 43169]